MTSKQGTTGVIDVKALLDEDGVNDSSCQAIWQAGFQPDCKPVSSHNESP